MLKLTQKIRERIATTNLAEVYRKEMGYRKMGLVLDDLVPEENALVQESLRRLPNDVLTARLFRFRRALNLSLTHSTLDDVDAITAQQDVAYLTPYLRMVENEIQSRDDIMLGGIPKHLAARNRSS